MARIISYPYDPDIKDADAWIGSEAATTRTKQYTAEALARYLNIDGKISIGAQMVFQYVAEPLLATGTFSITSGGLNNVPFANITTLTLSITDKGQQNTVAFLNYLVGSDILISEQNGISIFGHYNVVSYSENIDNPAYYDLIVSYKGGNGVLEFEEYYDVLNFVLASDSADKNFVFSQGVPAATWAVQHDLNKFPSCTMVLSTGQQGYGDVTFIDENNLTITFAGATSGKAYIN
jgi:hypothetical protein